MGISLAEKRQTRYESPLVIVVSTPTSKDEKFRTINEIRDSLGGKVSIVAVKIRGTLEP